MLTINNIMGLSPRQKAQRQQKQAQKKRAAERIAQQKSLPENKLIQLHRSYQESTKPLNRNTINLAKDPKPFFEFTNLGIALHRANCTEVDFYCAELLTKEKSKEFLNEHFRLLMPFTFYCYEKRGKGILVNPGLVKADCPYMVWHYELFWATAEDIWELPYLDENERLDILSKIDDYNPHKEFRVLLHRTDRYNVFRCVDILDTPDFTHRGEAYIKALEHYRSKDNLEIATWELNAPPYELRLLEKPDPDQFYISNLYCVS